MGFLAMFLRLLPQVVMGIETIAKDVAGKQKKQMATDIMAAVAQGVATVAPANAVMAAQSAALASAMIDQVVAIVKAPQPPVQPATASSTANQLSISQPIAQGPNA